MKPILENIWIILIVGLLFGAAISILFKIKSISSVANGIINDTLKIDGKWSRTSLTMLTAWVTVLWSYHYDVIRNGFNETAFGLMLSVAVGVKVTDAISKKINPQIKPTDENKV